MGLPRRAGIEGIVHKIEIHGHIGKEKVPGAAVSKEGHNESIFINFLPNVKSLCKIQFI